MTAAALVLGSESSVYTAPRTEHASDVVAAAAALTDAGSRVRAAGRKLALAAVSQLDLVGIAEIDRSGAEAGRIVAAPFAAEFFNELADPSAAWWEWEAEVLPEADVPYSLWRNSRFWLYLYAAVEQHIEVGAEWVEDQDGELMIAISETGPLYRWKHTAVEGPALPAGDPDVGGYYMHFGALPADFVEGLADGFAEVCRYVREARTNQGRRVDANVHANQAEESDLVTCTEGE